MSSVNDVINHMIERVIVIEHLSTALFDVFVDCSVLNFSEDCLSPNRCVSALNARGDRAQLIVPSSLVNCAIVRHPLFS